eukprot:TRINITY_DN83296_c0_g1_i2.p1 TRINITY_DN83296_c0_g1~~TRINITY_DN83296_c0_g1_i2.p1  ORF type:complete len:170 (+),score=42.46 TRINITY_DN83296_c0_g1_i2:40-510(+)
MGVQPWQPLLRMSSQWLRCLAALLALLPRGSGSSQDLRVHAVEGVRVGHVREIPGAADAQQMSLETLSLDPLVFRVHGLVTSEEADSIVALARSQPDWILSQAGDGDAEEFMEELRRSEKHGVRRLTEFDRNNDGSLGMEELSMLAQELDMPNYGG